MFFRNHRMFDFDIENYNYDLPAELIAQVPEEKRDHSRLMRVDRSGKDLEDRRFSDLPLLLRPGDLLVVNNTRVVPARLFGRKETGGRVELLVLPQADAGETSSRATRVCLFRSSKRPRPGSRLFFHGSVRARVEAVMGDGLVRVSFDADRPLDEVLEDIGRMPLPPYIKRDRHDRRSAMDRERYQTVFSGEKGAVAAPTAGLHFTRELAAGLERAGVGMAALTLHVGYGTFAPVREKDIRRHRLAPEFYRIPPETADAVARARAEGGRVVAVGTTVVRSLESAAGPDGNIHSSEGWTNLLVTPGYAFKAVDALITNFHLPRSSLLFLVAAFAGIDLVRKAYARAVRERYRFYSYGDAMLIL